MKRSKNIQKSTQKTPSPPNQEELLWIAEYGDVPTIDLHGLSTLTAEHELAQFVHEQSYRHTPVICIIHGHGTGKLKEMAEYWLRAHPELVAYARPSLGTRGSGTILAILHS